MRSLQAHPPVAASQARFVPGDLLLTTSDNRVIETTRSGAVVQVIPVPSPSGGNLGTGAYEAAQESVIDGNGNLAILQGLDTPYLTTINTDTGAVTQATVPGWNLSSDRRGLSPVAGALASLGSYLFANFTQSDATNPLGSLLRYDINARMFQAFGAPDAGTGVNKNYLSLAAGPDGLLYALTDAFYPGRSVLGTFVDVYDPNTLTLVRTIGLTAPPMSISGLEVGRIAVGLAGEIYALSNAIFDPGNVYKCDANGQSLATLTLPIPPKVEANNNGVLWNNLSADAEGNLVVGALEPALIDPSFQTVTNLDVFGSLTPPAGTAVSATFIGP